jgi:cardiolipin synthase
MLTAIIFFSCSTCMALQTSNIQLLLDRDYFPEVKKMINNSNRSIKMIMFEASYYKKFKNSPSNQLIDALIKAKKRGVDVEVILDIRQKSDRSTKRNLETGKMLTNAGVEVTFDTEQITTHSKLLIIDEKIIVIGSTNWTYNALNANHESSIVFDSRETATELMEFFEKIKKTGKKYSNF